MITRKGDIYFLADTSVNIDPTAEDLAEIALCAAETARRLDVVPRVAMLSFSSFGSTQHPLCEKVRKAVDLLHKADPALIVDGEIMADVAVSPEMLEEMYPFSSLKGGANVLICPDLNSANIAYKLLAELGGGRDDWPHPHGDEPSRCICCREARRWSRSSKSLPSPWWTHRKPRITGGRWRVPRQWYPLSDHITRTGRTGGRFRRVQHFAHFGFEHGRRERLLHKGKDFF